MFQDSNYLSDIGGVLGLWVGFSILTIFEFIEYAMDLIVLCCARRGARNRRPGSEGKIKPAWTEPANPDKKKRHPGDLGDEASVAAPMAFKEKPPLPPGKKNTAGPKERNTLNTPIGEEEHAEESDLLDGGPQPEVEQASLADGPVGTVSPPRYSAHSRSERTPPPPYSSRQTLRSRDKSSTPRDILLQLT